MIAVAQLLLFFNSSFGSHESKSKITVHTLSRNYQLHWNPTPFTIYSWYRKCFSSIRPRQRSN